METYEIRFPQEALDDLEDIVCYIARDNRSAALKMHDSIIAKATSLAALPKQGQYIADVKMRKAGYRSILIKPYIMFYRLMERYVFIYRVLHGTTNYPMLYESVLQAVGDMEEE